MRGSSPSRPTCSLRKSYWRALMTRRLCTPTNLVMQHGLQMQQPLLLLLPSKPMVPGEPLSCPSVHLPLPFQAVLLLAQCRPLFRPASSLYGWTLYGSRQRGSQAVFLPLLCMWSRLKPLEEVSWAAAPMRTCCCGDLCACREVQGPTPLQRLQGSACITQAALPGTRRHPCTPNKYSLCAQRTLLPFLLTRPTGGVVGWFQRKVEGFHASRGAMLGHYLRKLVDRDMATRQEPVLLLFLGVR